MCKNIYLFTNFPVRLHHTTLALSRKTTSLLSISQQLLLILQKMMKIPQNKNHPRISSRSIRSSKMIALDQLAYQQLQQSLGHTIQSYVHDMKSALKQMESRKANKIIKNMESSINKYLSYNRCSVLLLPKNKENERYNLSSGKMKQTGIFNQKLLNASLKQEQEYRRHSLAKKNRGHPGVLVDTLMRKQRVVTEPAESQNQKRMNKQLFGRTKTSQNYRSKHGRNIKRRHFNWAQQLIS